MKIAVAPLFGENCITAEDGRVLHTQICDALERVRQGERVEVDFNGAAVFASPFFNAAIGELLRDHEPAVLNKNLAIVGLPADAMSLLSRVIKNAREYFTNARVRKALDEAAVDASGDHGV